MSPWYATYSASAAKDATILAAVPQARNCEHPRKQGQRAAATSSLTGGRQPVPSHPTRDCVSAAKPGPIPTEPIQPFNYFGVSTMVDTHCLESLDSAGEMIAGSWLIISDAFPHNPGIGR